MTRTTARQIAVQLLFSVDDSQASIDEVRDLFFSEEHFSSLAEEDPMFRETPDQTQIDYICRLTDAVRSHTEELNEIINRYARGWKLERLSKATRTILRCALAEILYLADVPAGAAVNEAVELGKRFDSEDAASFINGILGAYLRSTDTDEESLRTDGADLPGGEKASPAAES